MIDLISIYTFIGFVWTIVLFYQLLQHTNGLLSKYYIIPFNFLFLGTAIYLVLNEVKYIERELPSNLHVLDIRYGYTSSDVLVLADLLKKNGRYDYAKFQIGMDTLAPPGFAGFISSVVLSTVNNKTIRTVCITLIWTYLISVLLANALTPVFILNYEYYIAVINSTGSNTIIDKSIAGNMKSDNLLVWLLTLLLFLIPWLDYFKYTFHGLAWILVLLDWMIQLFTFFLDTKYSTGIKNDAKKKIA